MFRRGGGLFPAVKREMHSGLAAAWVAFAQCAVAWLCACAVFQVGSLFM